MAINKDNIRKLFETALLLTSRFGFCKRYYAKDQKNRMVEYTDPNACKFCAIGFLQKARIELRAQGIDISSAQVDEAIKLAARRANSYNLADWSDSKGVTKRHLQQLFKTATSTL